MIRSRNGILRCLNRYRCTCGMAVLRCIRHNRCRLGGCLILYMTDSFLLTAGMHLRGSMSCCSMLCFRCITSHCRTRRCNRTDSTGLVSVRTAVFLRLRIVLNRLRLKRSILLCTVFRKTRVCCVLRIGILYNILRTILCSLRFVICLLCLRCNRRPASLWRDWRLGFSKIMRKRRNMRRNRRNARRNCRICTAYMRNAFAVNKIICVDADICILVRCMNRCCALRHSSGRTADIYSAFSIVVNLCRCCLRTGSRRCTDLGDTPGSDLTIYTVCKRIPIARLHCIGCMRWIRNGVFDKFCRVMEHQRAEHTRNMMVSQRISGRCRIKPNSQHNAVQFSCSADNAGNQHDPRYNSNTGR